MSSLPFVSVVCPNVSSNALGRALLLADLIRNDTQVRIVGMQQSEATWPPAASSPVSVEAYRFHSERRRYFDGAPWLREVVGSDFVIVSKPVLQSLGLSLLAGLGRHGMLVDIDDWQTGFFQFGRAQQGMTPLAQRLARFRSYARRAGFNGFTMTRLLEEYARRRTPRTVSNRWLQAKFGGELLYHVRDPKVLDPALRPVHDVTPLPGGRLWVGFVGTPRLHKGIDLLVNAVAKAARDAALGLVLMGVHDERDPSIVHARKVLGADGLRVVPPFPLDALRDHLATADILAIPSLEVPGSWGQIPAKLFDAMSMAKPIVASALNDIPEILDGVGLCVRAGDTEAFSSALVRLARDAELRAQLGAGARQRLMERYSYDVGRRILLGAVRRAVR
jgi:glycosyltransferase involved in cell wall biosynthesis